MFQKTLGNYMRIQMSYHAKCLEALTKAYKSVLVIEPEEDLEVSQIVTPHRF